MKNLSFSILLLTLTAINFDSAWAGGFKGGGGRVGGAGRVGGGGISGGVSRPASMPHLGGGGMTRPSNPVSRPSVSMPSVSRPNVGAPNLSRPSMPTTRPTPWANLPTGGLTGGGISGGIKPSFPSAGNRPTTLPGGISNRPSQLPANLPSTKPSFPSLGGGAGRPSTLPSKLPESRPGNLPNLPGNRPSTLPGNLTRPSPGDIGDFLGIPGGLKPAQRPGIGERPTTLPGKIPDLANRPGAGVNLPGANRPGGRPNTLPSRPVNLPTGIPGRPGANNRPINIGNINVGNKVINNRPSWVNIDNNRINVINNRWQSQIGGLHGWAATNPARLGYWNRWGNNIRGHWHAHGYHNRWFAGDWWYGHPGGVCRWHYYHRFNNYPWNYWWRRPTWVVASSWFAWSAPPAVWSQPIYYDYGTGGNVTYQNNNVYINGQQTATSAEFAESAAALATVEPPASEEQANAAEWLPLGTFALSTNESDIEPTRVVQLAVDKSGIVAGTLYNRETDQADAIQGRVDKETQRVAFRMGESDSIVAETGIYNLTQDEAPLLIHFGADRVENYVLVRLEQSDESDTTAQTGN